MEAKAHIWLRGLREKAGLEVHAAASRASSLRGHGRVKVDSKRLEAFEEGEVRPPLPVIEALLEVYEIAPVDRDREIHESYSVARWLRRLAKAKGVTLKHLASQSTLNYHYLTRIFSGARLLKSSSRLLEIADALGADDGEKRELLKLGDFKRLELDVGGDDLSSLAEALLDELAEGVGPSRPDSVGPFGVSEERNPEPSDWPQAVIRRLIDDVLTVNRENATENTVRIARAQESSGASEELTARMKAILESGVSVQLLIPLGDEPKEAVDRIFRTLGMLRHSGNLTLKWFDPATTAPPLSMVIGEDRCVWMLLPDSIKGRPYAIVPIRHGNADLIEHFERRSSEATELIRLFDSRDRNPGALDKALADAEERPGPLLIVKRRITSQMIPQRFWQWQSTKQKEGSVASVGTHDPWRFQRYSINNLTEKAPENLFDDLHHQAKRRRDAYRRKLKSEPVREMYLKTSLEDFLLTDTPDFPPPARVGIVDTLISRLQKHEKFEIGLVSTSRFLNGPLFGIHSENVVFFSVWQPGGQAEYLKVEHPAMARVFRQYFLQQWQKIPAKDRTKEDVCSWLRNVRKQIH